MRVLDFYIQSGTFLFFIHGVSRTGAFISFFLFNGTHIKNTFSIFAIEYFVVFKI